MKQEQYSVFCLPPFWYRLAEHSPHISILKDVMPQARHYVPEIRRFLISVLYHEARHKGIPMTKLVNNVLEQALAGGVGWQRATEATQPIPPPGQALAAPQGR